MARAIARTPSISSFVIRSSQRVMDIPLPVDKLYLVPTDQGASRDASTGEKAYVVLVSTGSFNPPTYMHLRMFELARDALESDGYIVIGAYISPVNDAYKKKGLVSAEHRLQLCNLACQSSEFVMVDSWEANQTTYQRTLTVLSRIQSSVCKSGVVSGGFLKAMFVCGSDLLNSFTISGVWIPEQVKSICRDYGVVCIRREGEDVEKIMHNDQILNENKARHFILGLVYVSHTGHIKVVDELIPNQISSTRIRECISKGLSIKYLTADEVIAYIKQNQLYL